MATVPDKHFDLAIVDPPYAVGASDGSFGAQKGKGLRKDLKHYSNHNKIPEAEYFSELKRLSKNQIIWGANYYPQYLEHSGWICWFKEMTGPLSDLEFAYQSINKVCKAIKHRWSGFVKEESDKGVVRIHPNQKPVSIYKWLLKNYAKEGDKILDTHGCSMSSAIACHQMGFDLTLCELDKDYYEAGVKRYKEQTMQQSLFK
jgi:site-specific DNA-methyltransferase (adenine-specific)